MDLKQDLKDHIGLELQGLLGPYVEQKQDVSGTSTASSKETALHPARLSFNAPKYIHTHRKVVGRDLLESVLERDAELLFPWPEYTICLKAKHGPVCRAPSAGSVYPQQCTALIFRVCGEEQLGWVGKSTPSLQASVTAP